MMIRGKGIIRRGHEKQYQLFIQRGALTCILAVIAWEEKDERVNVTSQCHDLHAYVIGT